MKKNILERISSGPDGLIEELVKLHKNFDELKIENEALKSRVQILEMNSVLRDQLLSLNKLDINEGYPSQTELDISSSQFDNAGFYELEEDPQGNVFRWTMSTGASFIRVKLNREANLRFSIKLGGVHESVDIDTFHYSIDDNEWKPVRLDNYVLTGVIPSATSPNTVIRIKHKLASDYVPSEQGDKRSLGVVVSNIIIHRDE
ncbi:hypothetical protein [Alteromonas stellipolaris]|uniref:hypothetical protein n=1 Tax=Alteromonas stellipolaris TaxID=233316 RepID=UPI001D344818|nr:hypothetical protein [Alteromonas stellipolaris]MBZ2163614.1 hypothetical protein [Alteromonas stellipolaris]